MSSTSLSPAQKLDLSDPDKFELASAVTKNSRSGITLHKRLLVIKKGYLYYYSNVPKKFKGDASIVQTIHQLPKCSIQIVNIKQIKGYQSNSSYFSIQFESRNMLQRQDIRKTMTLEQYNFSPKHTTQNIVWQFTCDNQFIKQRWVAALEGLHQYYTKQKKDIEKFFNQNGNMSEMKSSSSGGRDSRVPWRQSQSQSGNNNRGSYKRYGEVSFLQLVGTKSNDQRGQKSRQRQQLNNRDSGDKKNISNSKNIGNVNSNKNNNVDNASIKNNNTLHYNNNNNNKLNPFVMGQSSPSSSQSSLSKLSESGNNKGVQITSINKMSLNMNNNNNNSPIKGLQLSQIVQHENRQYNSSYGQQNHDNNMIGSNVNNKLSYSKTSTLLKANRQQQQFQEQSQQNIGIQQQHRQHQQQQKVNDIVAGEFEKELVGMEQSVNIHQGNQENEEKYGELIKKHSIAKQSMINISLNNNNYNNQDKDNNNRDNNKISLQSKNYLPNSKSNIIPNSTSNIIANNLSQSFTIKQIQKLSFYQLYQYIFCKQLTFSQRIQVQKLFYVKMNEFANQSVKVFMQFVDSLGSDNFNSNNGDKNRLREDNYKMLGLDTLYTANNMLVMRHSATNTIYKVAFVTSQPLTINSQQRVYFDEQAIKNLKRQYKLLNNLHKQLILSQIKVNNSFRLRVPMSVWVEYKGVVALVVDQICDCFDYDNNNNSNKNKNKNDGNSKSKKKIMFDKQNRVKYQKQLDALISIGYDVNDFAFTQCSLCNNQEEEPQFQQPPLLFMNPLIQIVTPQLSSLSSSKIIQSSSLQQTKKNYLKRLLSLQQPQKHHNIQFDSPFTHNVITKAKQTHASTSIQSLQFYLQTLFNLDQKSFQSSSSSQTNTTICTKHQIIHFLQTCLFVKLLRKLYRSAQGQLEQMHFITLVFAQDQGMKKVLQQAGCQNVPKLTGLVVDLIEYYLGLIIKVDVKKLTLHQQQQKQQKLKQKQSKSNKTPTLKLTFITSIQLKPIILTYDLSKLQVQETFNKISQFLSINNNNFSNNFIKNNIDKNILLAKNAITIIQSMQYESFPLIFNKKMLTLTKYKSQLAYNQQDYLGCIQACNHQLKIIDNAYSNRTFQTYLLMLKAYTYFEENQFLFVYDRLLQMVRFNYGGQSSVLISVYSIGAFLLKGMVVASGVKEQFLQGQFQQRYRQKIRYKGYISDNSNKQRQLLVLGLKLMDQAQQLGMKLFGPTSQHYINILLDMVRFYSGVNKQKCINYHKKVKHLIISLLINNNNNSSSNYNIKLVDCLLLELRMEMQMINTDDNVSLNNSRSNNGQSYVNKGASLNKCLGIIQECERVLFQSANHSNNNNNNNNQNPSTNSNHALITISKLPFNIITKLIQIQTIKFQLGFKFLLQYEYLVQHAILILWQTQNDKYIELAIIMLSKLLLKNNKNLFIFDKGAINGNNTYDDINQFNKMQLSNQLSSSSITLNNQSITIQSAIGSVIKFLLSTNINQTKQKRSNIITKAKIIIQEQQLLQSKQNYQHSLTYLLKLISIHQNKL